MIGLKTINKRLAIPVTLTAVLLLALALRLYGIRWGLPDVSHPGYSFHPDEALHLLFARMLVSGEIIDKHFIYGGTFYYTILNAYYFFADRLDESLGGFNHLASSILLGRYFHTAIALLTILIVYECGRAFYGRKIGMLAAMVLAVAPGHIVCAQRMRPDEFAAFLATLIILLSWQISSSDQGKKLRYYLFAGLTVGLAIALRFPLVTLIGAPLAVHVFGGEGKNIADRLWSLWDRRVAIMFVAVIAGYAIASPHTFIYPEWLIQGIKKQWWYQSNPFMDAVDNGPGIYQYGWTMLHEALGYPLYFLALGGVVLALARRSQADIVILAAGVPYFILTTFTSWVVVRYTLPLLPLLAILAGRFVAYAMEKIPRHKTVTNVVIAVTLAWTMLADYAYLKMETEKDVRDVATEWIQRNLPRGSSILIMRAYLEDDFFNPVIPQGYGVSAFLLAKENNSQALFRDYKFDYLILHEFTYKNMERLGPRNPHQHERVFHASLLNSYYRRIKEFKQPIEAMGIDFSSWFTSQDYTIADPGIRIYEYQS